MRGLGGFVRVLLPLRLDDGTSLSCSLWLAVESEHVRRACAVWPVPACAGLLR